MKLISCCPAFIVEEKGGGAFVTPTLALVKCRVTIKSKRKARH